MNWILGDHMRCFGNVGITEIYPGPKKCKKNRPKILISRFWYLVPLHSIQITFLDSLTASISRTAPQASNAKFQDHRCYTNLPRAQEVQKNRPKILISRFWYLVPLHSIQITFLDSLTASISRTAPQASNAKFQDTRYHINLPSAQKVRKNTQKNWFPGFDFGAASPVPDYFFG